VQTLKTNNMERDDNIDAVKMRFEAEKMKLREEREKTIKQYWENLPKLNNPEDVPTLPKVDEKQWKEFYVPKLIEAGAIPKNDLIHGQIYIGDHRNTTIARWNQETNKFDHMRYKFGWREDECNHFEDDDGFALFVPIRLGTQEEWDERIK
jgi:hypothetical protein